MGLAKNRGFFVWTGLSVGLCWLPSGWLNDLEACLLPALDGSSAWGTARDYLVHGLLIAGVSYSLMRGLSIKCGDLSSEDPQSELATPNSTAESSNAGTASASSPIVTGRGSKVARIVLVLSLVLLLAFLIEVGQALLPVSFHRGFGFGDLVASFVGGLVGVWVVLRQ